jgi:opacity protein-like surface antigen
MTKKLVLIVVLVLAFAASAAAQQVRVNHNRTPLRAEPTTTSPALAFYDAGTALDLVGVTSGWYKVRDPKTKLEGFIVATLVDELPGSKPLPSGTAAGAASLKAPPQGQARPGAPGKPGAQTKPKAGIRAFGDVSLAWMAASESFTAVTGSDSRVQYGGGVQAVNLWKGLYAEVMVGYSSLTGSRAFVYEGTVYDLDIPVTITFMPVDAGGGWRFPLGKSLHGYVGGGVTFVNYEETSDFANSDDDVSEAFTGYYAAGGLEMKLAAWLHLRAEGRFTRVPDALGAGGVSREFDETDLGGAALAVKLVFGR